MVHLSNDAGERPDYQHPAPAPKEAAPVMLNIQDTEWTEDRVVAGALTQATAALAGPGANDASMQTAEALVIASYKRLVAAVATARGAHRTD